MGGVDRRFAFAKQRPFTTPAALNVRSDGAATGRERGGSRPGLVKAFDQRLDGPIRFMDTVNVVPEPFSPVIELEGFESYVGQPGPPDPPWLPIHLFDTSPPFFGFRDITNVVPTISDAALIVKASSDTRNWAGYAASKASAIGLEADAKSFASLTTEPSNLGQYSVGFLLGDSLSTADAIVLRFQNVDSVNYASVTTLVGGDKVDEFRVNSSEFGDFTGVPSGPSNIGTPWNAKLNLQLESDGSVRYDIEILAFVTGPGPAFIPLVFSRNVSNVKVRALLQESLRPFFAILVSPGNVGKAGGFLSNLASREVVTDTRSVLIVSSNGDLWHDDNTGDALAQTTHFVDLSSDKPLQTTEYLQKLYVADYGNEDTDKPTIAKVYDPAFDTLVEWFADVFIGTTKGGTPPVFTDGIVVPGGPEDEGEPLGTVELGCRLIASWNERIVLARPDSAPHAWFMSRQEHPNNWDYSGEIDRRAEGGTGGAEDPAAAVASTTSSLGSIGFPITALAPHSDDYLILGALGSLWMMRGDPGYGGQIINLSRDIGILSASAWAYSPSSELIFLSQDGLYLLAPGGGGFPVSVSRERLPQELNGLNPAQVQAHLEYDVADRGIHIFLVDSGGGQQHWWFDWETKSFWPVNLPEGLLPERISYYQQAFGGDKTGVLLGSRDGYVRRFDPVASTDDGVAFGSFVMYGPIRLAQGTARDGMLQQLVGIVAQGSGDVKWSVHVGPSPEAAANATAFKSGVWESGYNPPVYVRARGNAMFLKLSGTGAPWSIEEVSIVSLALGKQRIA